MYAIFSREATSEIYGPQVYFLLYYFQIYYSKNPKIPCCFFFFLCFCQIYLSNPIQFYLSQYRGGIDNPSYALGCKYLFFVCRYHLYCVAWFSYWIDNLGFITKGNTYRCYAASFSPLRGNTNADTSNHRPISEYVYHKRK